MLIVVGEVAQKSKKTPSVVRLRPVEDYPVRRRDFLESFPSLGEPLAGSTAVKGIIAKFYENLDKLD
jgi:hypothetical protein